MKSFFMLTLVFAWLDAVALVAQPLRIDTLTPNKKFREYAIPSITVSTTRAEKATSPITFSELTRTQIEKLYTTQDLPVLLGELPSVISFSENGNSIGYSNLSMRGFDQRRIAVLVNGVPQNDPEDHNVYWINMPDLASNIGSMQVQRGAGLMNYGQAAIGGSIDIVTNNFVNRPGVFVSAGLGFQQYTDPHRTVWQQNVQKYSVELSSGLIEFGGAQYALYGRVGRIVSAGYRDYSWADLTNFFVSAVRYDKHITTQLNVFGGPIRDGLSYTGVPRAYIADPLLRRRNYSGWGYDSTGRTVEWSVARRVQEVENFHQPHFEVLNDVYLAENLTLKSTLFYYTGNGFFDYDASWGSADVFRITPAYGFAPNLQPQNAIVRAFVGNRHGGWLPRLVWKANDRHEFTLGAEYRTHRSTHWGRIKEAENLPATFDYDYQFYSYNGMRDIASVFARDVMTIAPDLTVLADVQMVWHRYGIRNEKAGNQFAQYQTVQGTVGNGDQLFNITYLFVNPKIGLQYRLDEERSLRASVAYTSREPRMRNLYAASDSWFGATPLFSAEQGQGGNVRYDFSAPQVRPERLLNIEIGAQTQTERFSLSATTYWMEFFDELVRSGQRDIFGQPIDGNAPRTRHYGLEIEAMYHLVQWRESSLRLLGHATVSVNRIVDFTMVEANGTRSLAGNDIAGFPSQMGQVRLQYESPSLFASLSVRSVGAFYTDNFQNSANQNPTYTVVNYDMAYTLHEVLGAKHIRLRASVGNVFNALYSAGGNGIEFFPAAERNIYVGIEMGW
jgi:iron complex outermembrane receptor protein